MKQKCLRFWIFVTVFTAVLAAVSCDLQQLVESEDGAVTGITISPTFAAVSMGDTIRFTAEVSGVGNFDSTVWWYPKRGDMTGGLYTAPSSPGPDSVRAVSAVNGSVSASAFVYVEPPSDEKRISFTAYPIGHSDAEIYTFTEDGAWLVRITDLPEACSSPVWSSDGEWLAFGYGSGLNGDIAVIKPNGDGFANLTNTPGRYEGNPAWLPNGTRLVFSAAADGEPCQLWVMNSDGSNQYNVCTEPVSASSWITASWSPDGTQLAINSWRDGNSDIYVINLDGTTVTRLTNYSGNDDSPRWSPDGNWIGFLSDRDGLIGMKIYKIRPDGTELTKLVAGDDVEGPFAWSGDSSRIVFGNDSRIWIVTADGTGLYELALPPDSRIYTPMHPTWEP